MILELPLADFATYAFPGATLAIAMVAVAVSAFMGTRSSSGATTIARLNDLKDRVEELEDKVEDCEHDRARLERQNVSLMKRILKLENGDDAP